MPNVMEIWEPKPPGILWATPGLLGDPFIFITSLGVVKWKFKNQMQCLMSSTRDKFRLKSF